MMSEIKEFKQIIDSTLFNKEQKRPQSATPSRTKAAPAPETKQKCNIITTLIFYSIIKTLVSSFPSYPKSPSSQQD